MEFSELHPILQRQLRRCGIADTEHPPTPEQWQVVLGRINTSYEEAKEAEQLNERALELASAEMQMLYRNLEQKVAERTHEIELAQAELQATNEELQAQSEELEAQHQQLQRTNMELEIKTESLESQREILADQNIALEEAKLAFEAKADEAARASQYKSAFLASMSHELRTPLNSLLILSDILSQNDDGNLTEEQVKFAQTIHGAGSDLLELINQILDLAKIESGGVNVDVAPVPLREITEAMESLFRPFMKSKNLGFAVNASPRVPAEISSDLTKVKQILKNLLSNAAKFTDEGSITLDIDLVGDDRYGTKFVAGEGEPRFLSFAVVDTGVGIPEEKTEVIFEAFQQADQGTARKYGGTGLGLSISRELAKALGGDILVRSQRGVGSTFTLLLPEVVVLDQGERASVQDGSGQPEAESVAVQAKAKRPDVRTLLIVEDDLRFADILVDRARIVGFETVVAANGADAIRLANEHLPDAVTLDLRLPDTDGWSVLAAIRQNPALESVPVHIISVEEEQDRGRQEGTFGYLTKPVNRLDLDAALNSIASSLSRASRLLVLGTGSDDREAIELLLGDEGIEIVAVDSQADALAAIESGGFGGLVADLDQVPGDGIAMLERLRVADGEIPLIGMTSGDLTIEQRQSTHRHHITVIAKGDRSMERLLDETSLFLHGVSRKLPPPVAPKPAEPVAAKAKPAFTPNPDLAGRRVLIVDDDPRNVFAIGNLLERQEMVVLSADNGRAGLDALAANKNIDVVLMDIMMPEMDGYEAMRRIRSDHQYKKLPILALTALAMGTDRTRCIEAGASDYISKPVDPDQLLSLLRVWLHQ